MHRACLIFGLLLATSAQAKCPIPGQIVLQPDEFELAGYDAARGVIGVRPAALLAVAPGRPQAMRLAVPDQPFLLPVSSDQVQALTDGRDGGQLELRLQVRPAPGPRPPDDCATYVPMQPELTLSGEPIGPAPAAEADADADANTDGAAPAPEPHEVRLARPRSEPADAHFPVAQLQRYTAELAQVCLHRALGAAPVSSGAVILEFGISPAGQPRPVKVVLDQLLSDPVTRCLTARLDDTPALWRDWPPGGLLYQPVYFRPGPSSRPATGPDATGENSP